MVEEIVQLIEKYKNLRLQEVLNYNHYKITYHSTNLEGSTLTETEIQLLLDEGLTPKGKPLMHSLMAKDHYEALLFITEQAKQRRTISVEFIQAINARVLKSTGAVYNTLFGEVDSS